MTISYTVFTNSTGKIDSYGVVPDAAHYALIPFVSGQTVTTDSIDTDANWYYLGGVLTPRPLLTTLATWSTLAITANGISSAVLGSGLPNPTPVSIQLLNKSGVMPVTGSVTTGSLTITANYPGSYQVTTNIFPYKDYQVIIVAT